MRYHAIELAVGVFVLLAILAFTVLAFQVSGLATVYERDSGYDIDAYFDEIGGLKTRARVTIGGVQVGRVTGIVLDPGSYTAKVTMQINSRFRDLIPLDSTATIATAGLIGDKYILIEPGADYDMLQAGDVIDETYSAVILERLIGQFLFSQDGE